MDDELAVVKRHLKAIPVNIRALFRELGLEYKKSFDLDECISGELERISEDRFVIRTNATHSDERQRFTAAHELGHYILHRILIGSGVDDNKAYRSVSEAGKFKNSNIKSRHETEANRFAAIVLMPSELVRREHGIDKTLSALAGKFCVSEQAMNIRLTSLGLDDPA